MANRFAVVLLVSLFPLDVVPAGPAAADEPAGIGTGRLGGRSVSRPFESGVRPRTSRDTRDPFALERRLPGAIAPGDVRPRRATAPGARVEPRPQSRVLRSAPPPDVEIPRDPNPIRPLTPGEDGDPLEALLERDRRFTERALRAPIPAPRPSER